ncbi:MAG: hypothetical protein IGBAC_1485 [Ignavibacteriae bacterium]|nr:MAG: hypothetical protein IGBAC_1485 [Ignavibacteriota bacterium]
MKYLTSLMLTIIILLIFSLSTFGQIPRLLSYQGVLTDSLGNPKPDGSYQITFRLYESAVGGSSIWSEEKTLEIKRGLFSTILGDQNPFDADVKFDKQYWMSLQVASEPELSPRIPLTAVGYSLNSLKADTAGLAITIPDGIVTTSKIADNSITSAKIADGTIIGSDFAENSITSPKIASGQVVKSLNGLRDNVYLSAIGGATINSSNDTIYINAGSGGGGTGIQGIQNTNNTLSITNPNGPTATVNLKVPLSFSDSLNNILFPYTERGVLKVSNFGTANSIYGVQTGSGKSIHGLNTGTGIAGMFTIDNASNTNVALSGQTNGSGTAVYAYQTGTGMAAHALINNSASNMPALRTETNGSGVSAYAYQTGTGMAGHFHINNTSSSKDALLVETNGQGGSAAKFKITNASNNNPVINLETYGTGYALFANKYTTGTAVEVRNTSTDGRAGWFQINNASNPKDALSGVTNGSGDGIQGIVSGSGVGVRGECSSTSGYGGWFEIKNISNNKIAIGGVTNGSGTAVFGSNSGTGYAGLFQQTNPSTFTQALVASHANSNAYALWVEGNAHVGKNLYVHGSKSAVVPIGVSNPENADVEKNAEEWRALYCVEATELWFEDFGFGKLNNGSVTIQIENIFSKTVNTNADYHVFITPYGECKQLYVTNKTPNSFTVIESDNGSSSIEFSYRIVAKRLGYEDKRLERINLQQIEFKNNEILKPQKIDNDNKQNPSESNPEME